MTPERIRTLLVDDEPLARRGIRGLLAGDAEIDVVGECGNGRDAARDILAHAPDLVFLDVQMPEMDGFQVLEAVGAARMPAVVFVTAYDRFAVRAFDVHALDYLLKPFDDERFERTVRRVKERFRQRAVDGLTRRLVALLDGRRTVEAPARPQPAPAGRRYADAPPARDEPPSSRLLVRSGRREIVVLFDEVDWIEAADYYVRLHVGGRSYLHRESLSALEARLDPARFVRVHRSAIVRLDAVAEVRSSTRGDHVVALRDGTRLRLSKSRRGALTRLLAPPR